MVKKVKLSYNPEDQCLADAFEEKMAAKGYEVVMNPDPIIPFGQLYADPMGAAAQ